MMHSVKEVKRQEKVENYSILIIVSVSEQKIIGYELLVRRINCCSVGNDVTSSAHYSVITHVFPNKMSFAIPAVSFSSLKRIWVAFVKKACFQKFSKKQSSDGKSAPVAQPQMKIEYRQPKCKTTYLRLQSCKLPVKLYFFIGKSVNLKSWKLPWFSFFISIICCRTFKLVYKWLVPFRKSKIGAEFRNIMMKIHGFAF